MQVQKFIYMLSCFETEFANLIARIKVGLQLSVMINVIHIHKMSVRFIVGARAQPEHRYISGHVVQKKTKMATTFTILNRNHSQYHWCSFHMSCPFKFGTLARHTMARPLLVLVKLFLAIRIIRVTLVLSITRSTYWMKLIQFNIKQKV